MRSINDRDRKTIQKRSLKYRRVQWSKLQLWYEAVVVIVYHQLANTSYHCAKCAWGTRL